MPIIQIPFAGFYESKWSGEIDRHEEQSAEYEASEREEGEKSHPTEMRLSESEIAGILFDVTDYSAAYLTIAREYVEAFNDTVGERLDLDLKLTFESMSSPKYYNFETDRVFAEVPQETVQALFDLSAEDSHKRLGEMIEKRHSSRSGFISHYSNKLAEWLAKSLDEWDHNELCTLLMAVVGDEEDDNGDDLEWSIYHSLTDGDGFYQAWSDAVDWAKYAEKVAEARAEKLEAIREEQPDFVLPELRCPFTLDLFV
jgi:hypothetical protein